MKTLFISVAIAVSCMVIGTVSAQNFDISDLTNENIEILMNANQYDNWIERSADCANCNEPVKCCFWAYEGVGKACTPGICQSCGTKGKYFY